MKFFKNNIVRAEHSINRTCKICIRLSLVALSFLIASCQEKPREIPAVEARGDESEFIVAQRRDPGNWDPIDTFLVVWGSVGSNIYDGLVYRNEKLELQPGLALRWEYLDDNTRIRFTLRENVTFHNGEPFNAAAVQYTFDRLLGDEGLKGPQRSNYTSIQQVKIVDDYTVDFHLNAIDPVLLIKLSGYGAMIVPPDYIKEKGEKHFDTAPVGTGPFKFISYKRDAHLKLAKNEDHWRGAPKIERLTYRFIPESNTRLAELQSGSVDILMAVEISDVEIIRNHKDLTLETIKGPVVYSLRFKPVDAVTEDVRVRKAINMAVDRKSIVESLLQGYGSTIASFQSSLSFGYDPNLKEYPYDVEKAKQLLKEANVQEGTLLTIDFRSNNATFKEVSQAVASYLEAVGFTVKINPVETGLFLNDIVPNGKTNELYQSSWGGWTFDYDNTAYLMYHSGEKWNPYGTTDEIDALLEKQRSIVDVEQRKQLLQEIARKVADAAYALPLYNLDALYGVHKRVKNFTPAPDTRIFLLETSK